MRHIIQMAKISFVKIAQWSFTVAGFLLLVWATKTLPWWALLAIWLVGVVVTHVGLYRGFVGRPRLTDLSAYWQDSGVAMVILMWPLALILMFGPMWVEYGAERLVGIHWKAGVRYIDGVEHP